MRLKTASVTLGNLRLRTGSQSDRQWQEPRGRFVPSNSNSFCTAIRLRQLYAQRSYFHTASDKWSRPTNILNVSVSYFLLFLFDFLLEKVKRFSPITDHNITTWSCFFSRVLFEPLKKFTPKSSQVVPTCSKVVRLHFGQDEFLRWLVRALADVGPLGPSAAFYIRRMQTNAQK